jgi:hypothetical protein
MSDYFNGAPIEEGNSGHDRRVEKLSMSMIK